MNPAGRESDEYAADAKLKRKEYEHELARLHVEFVKLQQWVIEDHDFTSRGQMRNVTDRFRDPALTVLRVLEASLIFLGAPLAAKGVPLVRPIISVLGPFYLAITVARIVTLEVEDRRR